MRSVHFRKVHKLELERLAIQTGGTDARQRNAAKRANSGFIALQYLVAALAAARKKQIGEISEKLFQVHFCVIQ